MANLPEVKVEVAFDSGVLTPAASRSWTDISDYVELDQQITIQRGRADEFATTSPSTLSLSLDNSDGRFTPGNASSPYYPDVKIGRPIRVTTTTPAPLHRNLLTATQASLESGTTGGWAGLGSASVANSTSNPYSGTKSLAVTWPPGGTPWVQQTIAGLTVGVTYTFSAYVFVPSGSPDVFLQARATSPVSGLATSVKNALTRVSVTFEANGTSQALRVVPSGATTSGQQVFVDGFMLNVGSAAGDFNTESVVSSVRFTGYVDEWPVEWPGGVSGHSRVVVTASSRLARLGEGAELRSVVETEILADSPTAYYPLTEPEGALFAQEYTGRDHIGMYHYFGGTGISFGTGDGVATDNAPAARVSSRLDGEQEIQLAAYYAHTSSLEYTLSVFASVDGEATDDSLRLLELFNGDGWLVEDYQRIKLFVTDTSFSTPSAIVEEQKSGAYTLLQAGFFDGLQGSDFWDGAVHHFALTYVHHATSPTLKFYLDGVLQATQTVFSLGSSLSSPFHTNWLIWAGDNAVTDGQSWVTLSHLAVYDEVLSDARIEAIAKAGLDGFSTELAGERIERIAGYADVELVEVNADAGTVPIAHIDTTDQTVESLLRTVELTENGILYDARDGTLRFRDRDHRYGATAAFTLDATAQQIEAEGFRPVLDRTAVTNSVTAKSLDGTLQQRYSDDTSAQDYGHRRRDIDIATTSVDQLYQAAAWRVARYKDPLPRFASLAPVDVLTLSSATRDAIRDADISTRFAIANLPAQSPGGATEFFIEGITETLAPESWRFTFNASPAAIYDDLFVLNTSTLNGADVLAY